MVLYKRKFITTKWFSIRLLISVIYIARLKNKNMVIPNRCRKSTVYNLTSFMIKLRKLGVEGSFLKCLKDIYKNPIELPYLMLKY